MLRYDTATAKKTVDGVLSDLAPDLLPRHEERRSDEHAHHFPRHRNRSQTGKARRGDGEIVVSESFHPISRRDPTR
jgi:hypothetical protein